jgi:hypothetical protein
MLQPTKDKKWCAIFGIWRRLSISNYKDQNKNSHILQGPKLKFTQIVGTKFKTYKCEGKKTSSNFTMPPSPLKNSSHFLQPENLVHSLTQKTIFSKDNL